jgi:hypothetical protein
MSADAERECLKRAWPDEFADRERWASEIMEPAR